MMEAHLGVTTCDKCGEPMKEEQNILIVAEGAISSRSLTMVTRIGTG